MIGWSEYERTTAAKAVGRRVRTLADLRSAWCRIPAGAVLTVTAKRNGYTIEGQPCLACGVTVIMVKVRPNLLEWVTVPYPQDCLCAHYPDGVALDCHVHNGAPCHFDSVCLAVPLEAIAAPTLNEDHPCHCP